MEETRQDVVMAGYREALNDVANLLEKLLIKEKYSHQRKKDYQTGYTDCQKSVINVVNQMLIISLDGLAVKIDNTNVTH
jgi:hypothetical protein